jgi:hypothetical protein
MLRPVTPLKQPLNQSYQLHPLPWGEAIAHPSFQRFLCFIGLQQLNEAGRLPLDLPLGRC